MPVRRAAGALKLPVVIANPFATRRAPLHAPEFPLVLLFTEKAGCTSLSKWFLFHIGKLEEASRAYPSSVHDYRKFVLYRQRGYGWQGLRLIASRQKPVVKLVRDPYTRAVSSFLQALSSARSSNRKVWGRDLVTAARRHAGKSALPASLSFRDFLRFVAATGTERGQINGHVARQHVTGEDGHIDRIIKLERFAEEIRAIEAEYGLAASPLDLIITSRHHRTGRQQEHADQRCSADLDLTPERVRKGEVPAYEALYDEETRQLVRTAFAADFKAYGYDG